MLEDLLRAAKDKITLNLDVKDAIYAEVVDAVVPAGATDLVNVKTRAGIASPPLASVEPFVRVPFIPVLDPRGSDVVAVAEQQLSEGKSIALELARHVTGKGISESIEAAVPAGAARVKSTT